MRFFVWRCADCRDYAVNLAITLDKAYNIVYNNMNSGVFILPTCALPTSTDQRSFLIAPRRDVRLSMDRLYNFYERRIYA